MSVADTIRASVTEEWRSTTEIATECGVTSPRAYVVLSKLVKYGIIEKDLVSPCARPGGVVAVWRRSQ